MVRSAIDPALRPWVVKGEVRYYRRLVHHTYHDLNLAAAGTSAVGMVMTEQFKFQHQACFQSHV